MMHRLQRRVKRANKRNQSGFNRHDKILYKIKEFSISQAVIARIQKGTKMITRMLLMCQK